MNERSSFFRVFAGVVAGLLVVASSAIADDEKDRRAQRYEDLAVFTSVLELVRSKYVEDVDEHALHRRRDSEATL